MPALKANTPLILDTFCQASLIALIRAEQQERVPLRFTGVGQEVWKTFRNELNLADLLVLAIQDAAASMPIPFDPQIWSLDENITSNLDYRKVPTWSEFQVSLEAVERWLPEAVHKASLPVDSYLREQAALLNVSIPSAEVLNRLSTPQKHEHWLELPGTGGLVAYALCSRASQELYLWENFTILCARPEEMILAGFIAWELGAPPNIELPILLDDSNLSKVINLGQTFHAVVGKRAEHGHRDLRFLQQDSKHPLWL